MYMNGSILKHQMDRVSPKCAVKLNYITMKRKLNHQKNGKTSKKCIFIDFQMLRNDDVNCIFDKAMNSVCVLFDYCICPTIV